MEPETSWIDPDTTRIDIDGGHIQIAVDDDYSVVTYLDDNGQPHRDDGPAVINYVGRLDPDTDLDYTGVTTTLDSQIESTAWYWHGEEITEPAPGDPTNPAPTIASLAQGPVSDYTPTVDPFSGEITYTFPLEKSRSIEATCYPGQGLNATYPSQVRYLDADGELYNPNGPTEVTYELNTITRDAAGGVTVDGHTQADYVDDYDPTQYEGHEIEVRYHDNGTIAERTHTYAGQLLDGQGEAAITRFHPDGSLAYEYHFDVVSDGMIGPHSYTGPAEAWYSPDGEITNANWAVAGAWCSEDVARISQHLIEENGMPARTIDAGCYEWDEGSHTSWSYDIESGDDGLATVVYATQDATGNARDYHYRRGEGTSLDVSTHTATVARPPWANRDYRSLTSGSEPAPHAVQQAIQAWKRIHYADLEHASTGQTPTVVLKGTNYLAGLHSLDVTLPDGRQTAGWVSLTRLDPAWRALPAHQRDLAFQAVLDQSRQAGRDLIVEVDLADPDSVRELATQFTNAGYDVHAVAVVEPVRNVVIDDIMRPVRGLESKDISPIDDLDDMCVGCEDLATAPIHHRGVVMGDIFDRRQGESTLWTTQDSWGAAIYRAGAQTTRDGAAQDWVTYYSKCVSLAKEAGHEAVVARLDAIGNHLPYTTHPAITAAIEAGPHTPAAATPEPQPFISGIPYQWGTTVVVSDDTHTPQTTTLGSQFHAARVEYTQITPDNPQAEALITANNLTEAELPLVIHESRLVSTGEPGPDLGARLNLTSGGHPQTYREVTIVCDHAEETSHMTSMLSAANMDYRVIAAGDVRDYLGDHAFTTPVVVVNGQPSHGESARDTLTRITHTTTPTTQPSTRQNTHTVNTTAAGFARNPNTKGVGLG